jgi:hypothetical protein
MYVLDSFFGLILIDRAGFRAQICGKVWSFCETVIELGQEIVYEWPCGKRRERNGTSLFAIS